MEAITWRNSPTTEAVARVLETLLPDKIAFKRPRDGKDYLLVSYREDFNFLWELDDSLLNWLQDGNRTIVLVWDETPSEEKLDSVNVRDYLSGFDWAVALSLSDLEARQSQIDHFDQNERPSWRLIILDLASKQHAGSDTVRLFKRLQENKSILPWVSVDGIAQLKGFFCELLQRPELHPDKIEFDLLRRLWIGILTKPANSGDRHAISNLIGPQVLLSGMDLEINQSLAYRSPNLSALRNLFRSLGLVPSEQDKEELPWVSPGECKQLNPRFILLDDMHELGWADFLKGALGIHKEDDERLAVFSNPNATEFGPESDKTLLDLLQDDKGKLRINQGLKLVADDGAGILFLDLRLFAGRAEDEFKFFRGLLMLARQAQEGGQSSYELPWMGFTDDELKAVERCLSERKVETSNYYTALTLLPRLISLVDPKLPVVLFSSTGQRRIVDSLKSYGNIITDFDKPRFFGDSSSTIVTETKNRFRRAIETGFEIIRGRRACQSLDTYVETSNALTDRKDGAGWIEYYFDESGSHPDSKEFSVGGLAIMYPTKDAAANFWSVLERNKLQWGYHRDNPWVLPPVGERLGKASEVTVETVRRRLAALDKVAKENDLEVAAFLLKSSISSAANLTSVTGPDFVFRKLVRLAIEILLFEWLPLYERITGKRIPASIYVAKRSWVAPPSELIKSQNNFGLILHPLPSAKTDYCFLLDDEAVRKDWLILKDELGFLRSKEAVTAQTVNPESKKVKIAAYSFSFDSVHPMITEILALRGAKKTVPAALGVGLPYNEDQGLTPNQLPRQIHYAADYVASCPEAVPEEWWKNGFEDSVDQGFEYVLNASRACDDPSTRVDAITEWEKGRLFMKAVKTSFSRWVGQRVSDCSRQLRGEEFIRLCKLLTSDTDEGNGVSIEPAKTNGGNGGILLEEPRIPLPCEIYVGNLPYSTTREMLRRKFVDERFDVLGVKIVKDFATKQSRGFGFVRLASEQQAEAAILKLNGVKLDGRRLVVRIANKRVPGVGA